MVTRLIVACSVMAVCVTIHAAGLALAMRWLRHPPGGAHPVLANLRLFIRLAVWIVILHLVEILAWAGLYLWNGALPDLPTAVYFSAVTYTTTGYGDVVLPPGWRLDGGVEALTGILMCGWSTGFFFALVNRLYQQPQDAARS
jgi:voltage-gated potassium channel Kch